MNKKKAPILNIGASSILSVFIILAMLTFAMLAFMTARKDASRTAEQLAAAAAWSGAVQDAHEELARRTADWETNPPAASEYRFTVPLAAPGGEYLELLVVYRPRTATAADPALYTVTTFQKVSTKEWRGDQSLHLFGEDDFTIQ